MKATLFLLVGALVFSTTSTFAFKIGDLSKGAESITDAAGNSELVSMGADLMKAFKGNKTAMNAAKGLMDSFKAEDYLKGFKYYDKIQGAGLSDSQLKTWNSLKGALSAVVLERNFDFSEKGLASLVTKASAAMQDGGITKATKYLGQLKDAATLTGGQKELLTTIVSHLPLAQ